MAAVARAAAIPWFSWVLDVMLTEQYAFVVIFVLLSFFRISFLPLAIVTIYFFDPDYTRAALLLSIAMYAFHEFLK